MGRIAFMLLQLRRRYHRGPIEVWKARCCNSRAGKSYGSMNRNKQAQCDWRCFGKHAGKGESCSGSMDTPCRNRGRKGWMSIEYIKDHRTSSEDFDPSRKIKVSASREQF